MTMLAFFANPRNRIEPPKALRMLFRLSRRFRASLGVALRERADSEQDG